MHATATRALAALADPKSRVRVRKAQGIHCPAQVVVSQDTTDYTFELLADNVWRLGYVSTYGNGSFVYGEGCDASGWVVRDAKVARTLAAKVAR